MLKIAWATGIEVSTDSFFRNHTKLGYEVLYGHIARCETKFIHKILRSRNWQ